MREIDIPTLLAAMALLPPGARSVDDRAAAGTRFLRSMSARAVIDAHVGAVDRGATFAATSLRS